MDDGQEMTWQVDGLRLAGLAWGPQDGRRVLALHGWLDNALSFRALAAALPECRIVALDLPGQGLSAYRSPDATYQIWDDVPQIAGVLDALGWDRFTLMGHSRGAVIASISAAALADRTDALVCLDWMLPPPLPDAEIVPQFRRFLAERTARPERSFASREDYVARRMSRGNTRAIAELLAGRALRADAGGFRMLGDPRLYGASAVKFGQAHVTAVLEALDMPVIWFSCREGQGMHPWAATLQDQARARIAQFDVVPVEGHHHAHMEDGPARAIAARLAEFWPGPAIPPR